MTRREAADQLEQDIPAHLQSLKIEPLVIVCNVDGYPGFWKAVIKTADELFDTIARLRAGTVSSEEPLVH